MSLSPAGDVKYVTMSEKMSFYLAYTAHSNDAKHAQQAKQAKHTNNDSRANHERILFTLLSTTSKYTAHRFIIYFIA